MSKPKSLQSVECKTKPTSARELPSLPRRHLHKDSYPLVPKQPIKRVLVFEVQQQMQTQPYNRNPAQCQKLEHELLRVLRVVGGLWSTLSTHG
eukprot:4819665-Amphidinium_carterae.1